MKKNLLVITRGLRYAVIASVIFLSACKKDDNNPKTPSPKTISGIVSAEANFSLLNSAIVKAALTSTLSSAGPFTVFAPDNTAFAASGITAGVIGSLSADQLKDILLYHTIAGKIGSSAVPAGPNAKVVTASGDSVFVTRNSSGVFVNGSKVKQADVPASNGVIHVISNVLIPASGNIVQEVQADTSLTYLVAAVLRASTGSTNVAGVLSGSGPFTLFAPTNNAFRAAGFSTINDINAADPNALTTILTYHVIAGRIFSSDLTDGAQPTTVNGGKLTIGLTGGATVKGNGNSSAAGIIQVNEIATNGVIHIIDKVLLP